LNQAITRLVEVAPVGSAIAIEAGWILDERILPAFETWDIRRYGDTRIAIKVVPEPQALEADAPIAPALDAAVDEPAQEEEHGG
jgi:hypothetical protein